MSFEIKPGTMPEGYEMKIKKSGVNGYVRLMMLMMSI